MTALDTYSTTAEHWTVTAGLQPRPSPIRTARELAGLTQQELADRLGVSKPAVSLTESRGDNASLATMRRYVEACGYKLELVLTPNE